MRFRTVNLNVYAILSKWNASCLFSLGLILRLKFTLQFVAFSKISNGSVSFDYSAMEYAQSYRVPINHWIEVEGAMSYIF